MIALTQRVHLWGYSNDFCLACGRSRLEIVDKQLECGDTDKYRDWLKAIGKSDVTQPDWLKEPTKPRPNLHIVPKDDNGKA